MTVDELREELITAVTDIIVAHQLPDYGHKCKSCKKRIYSGENGSSLSRHRAEKIVDDMDLVELHLSVEKEHGQNS